MNSPALGATGVVAEPEGDADAATKEVPLLVDKGAIVTTSALV